MASVDEILDALRNAKTEAEIGRVSDKYRADVKALHADPSRHDRYLHIINLKAYRLWQIRNPA
jgi:hypothetical protein